MLIRGFYHFIKTNGCPSKHNNKILILTTMKALLNLQYLDNYSTEATNIIAIKQFPNDI